MVTSHRLSFDVECPNCCAAGTILVIEEAGPPFAEPPRRTYSAEKFVVSPGDPLTLGCMACGAKFPGKF